MFRALAGRWGRAAAARAPLACGCGRGVSAGRWAMERYERPGWSDRSAPYESAEALPGSRREREGVRVPRRVVRNWERLVGAAVRDLEAAEQSDWSSEEGEDEEALHGMVRRPTKRYERSKSYVVPHSLSAQTDIDAVMEAAEDIQKDDIEVARICTWLCTGLKISLLLSCVGILSVRGFAIGELHHPN